MKYQLNNIGIILFVLLILNGCACFGSKPFLRITKTLQFKEGDTFLVFPLSYSDNFCPMDTSNNVAVIEYLKVTVPNCRIINLIEVGKQLSEEEIETIKKSEHGSLLHWSSIQLLIRKYGKLFNARIIIIGRMQKLESSTDGGNKTECKVLYAFYHTRSATMLMNIYIDDISN